MFSEQKTAAEFDIWAVNGRAESMASGHQYATLALLKELGDTPPKKALDVGCGNGWLVQELVHQGAGIGCGVDISAEMIARAQSLCEDTRCTFTVASAEELPFEDGQFNLVCSVESLYYYGNPKQALSEWHRVTAVGGRLAIMIDLYTESVGTHSWVDALPIPVHLRTIREWCQLISEAGWSLDRCWRELDLRPLPNPETFEPSSYWPHFDLLLAYRSAGSLCLTATKNSP